MISYRIIKKCRLIYIKIIGTLSSDEYLSMIKSLRQDSNFSYYYDIINDSREHPEPLTGKEIEKVASQIGPATEFPKVKHAIVVNGDVSYGMGRMFEMIADFKTRLDTQVFRDLDEALVWLGRTRADIEESE